MLAVRSMAAQTEWLSGRIVWHDGRVAWGTGGVLFTPGPEDLAFAQRRLYQIRRYPTGARLVLGDFEGWLAGRQDQLGLAKRLQRLYAPDLEALVERPGATDRDDVRRLVELLSAEAYCLDGVPASPAAALASRGDTAQQSLASLVEDSTTPLPVRALAALALGANRWCSGEAGAIPRGVSDSEWLRRCYNWGLRSGMPAGPALIATLLSHRDGRSLARRCLEALAPSGPFAAHPRLLRELLERGVPVERVVRLAEAMRDAGAVSERIMDYRDELPDRSIFVRRAAAERLRAERRDMLAVLAVVTRQYASASADPMIVDLASRLVGRMLDLPTLPAASVGAATGVLRRGLELPHELHLAYLTILVEQFDRIWDTTNVHRDRSGRIPPEWLRGRHRRMVQPLAALLTACPDAQLVCEAVELKVVPALAGQGGQDRAMYRLAMSLARDLGAAREGYPMWSVCRLLDGFADARAARAALQPLLGQLSHSSAGVRAHMLEVVLAELPYNRRDRLPALAAVVPYLRRIARYAAVHAEDNCLCAPVVEAIPGLRRNLPGQEEACVKWLLDHMRGIRPDGRPQYEQEERLRLGISLSLALAVSDVERFRRVVSAAARHRSEQRLAVLEEGIRELHKYPALHAPLAAVFSRQPRRCLELVARLGTVARLGSAAVASLAVFREAQGETVCGHGILTPDWAGLLEDAPELAPHVGLYIKGRHLAGLDTAVPAGVRCALESPRKLRRELLYLEVLLETGVERPALSARAATLRDRLRHDEALRPGILAEAAERLSWLTSQAWLCAAERLVRDCYRRRLQEAIGSLPPGLMMDDNLLNATLLLVHIRENRRLLQRLLRTYLAGDRSWVRRHPGNLAFLEKLTSLGVDADAWLRAWPRGYRCSGVEGGRVRLHLEGDPVRILQMGNLFDTCLSFDGCNAYSTVANACELNKRVIYATDGDGRVVGRKLIGIDAGGGLVGFHTYTSLSDRAGNEELAGVFDRYVRDFAARCGLPLHDHGKIPTLFAERWYDDGVVPWGESPCDGHQGSQKLSGLAVSDT